MYIAFIRACFIYSNRTVNINIPMVSNLLNANNADKKLDELLEGETVQQTAEGSYMMSDIGTEVTSSTFTQPLDPTDTSDKLESLQPLNPVDACDKLPPPIKVS